MYDLFVSLSIYTFIWYLISLILRWQYQRISFLHIGTYDLLEEVCSEDFLDRLTGDRDLQSRQSLSYFRQFRIMKWVNEISIFVLLQHINLLISSIISEPSIYLCSSNILIWWWSRMTSNRNRCDVDWLRHNINNDTCHSRGTIPRFVAFHAICCCMWKWITSIDHLNTQSFKFGRFHILSLPIRFNFLHY